MAIQLKKAPRLSGISEKTSLGNAGLKPVITQESDEWFAQVGGTEKSLHPFPRRRSTAR